MNDTKVKKQILEKIKESNNVLVALSASPSVDELSAALGLTLAINKIEKHATAIFSGKIPPAIDFLEPQKTFENNVTSLQDFIIALDKEKADHLRYKVDGDMVKIFITPYRTTIDEKDLEFSQGDYNVDFVIAIGVRSADDLDSALSSHGQILSDATVASVGLGSASELGTINWNDKNASSYSEIITSLVKDLGDKELIDEQIGTALLTGIVAATDRFSNAKTSSRVMTAAADLMAAGANQQLISVQLEQANEISAENDSDEPEEQEKPETDEPKESEPPIDSDDKPSDEVDANGELSISHEMRGDVDEVAQQVAKARQEDAIKEAEDKLSEQMNLKEGESHKVEKDEVPSTEAGAYEETPLRGAVEDSSWNKTGPSIGGTLNATTEQAADDKRREAEDTKNRTILSHDSGRYLDGEPTYNNPISAAANSDSAEPVVKDIFATAPAAPNIPVQAPNTQGVDVQPLRDTVLAPEPNALPPLPSFEPSITPPPMAEPVATGAVDLSSPVLSSTAALDEVNAALEAQPVAPASSLGAPVGLPALPPMPPMPDFGSLPPLPGAPAPLAEPNPFSGTPATIPSAPLGSTLPPAPVAVDPGKADPGQFQIPGQ